VKPNANGRSCCPVLRPTLVLCDVGPRDGLQNESLTLAPPVRAELCDRLLAAGLPRVEAVSFVNPRLVPQMAGAEEVMAAIHKRPPAVLAGLVLNERGLERALAAGVDEVHYAFGVTDTFSSRNQNTTVEGGVETSHQIVRRCRQAGLPVTVTLSVAFGCPFEGRVEPAQVLRVIEQVQEEPPDEIAPADTIYASDALHAALAGDASYAWEALGTRELRSIGRVEVFSLVGLADPNGDFGAEGPR